MVDVLIKPVMNYFNITNYQIVSVKADVNLTNLNKRGARIDCIVELENNKHILIEIQNGHSERMPLKRLRFNQGVYDSKQLKRGQNWEELPDVIDLVYTKEPLEILDNNKPVADLAICNVLDDFKIIPDYGVRMIVVNGKYKLDGFKEFTDVMEDLIKSDVDEINNPVIRDIHYQTKNVEEGKNMYKEYVQDQFEKIQEQFEKVLEEKENLEEQVRLKDEQHKKDQEEIRKHQNSEKKLRELLKKNNIPIPSI